MINIYSRGAYSKDEMNTNNNNYKTEEDRSISFIRRYPILISIIVALFILLIISCAIIINLLKENNKKNNETSENSNIIDDKNVSNENIDKNNQNDSTEDIIIKNSEDITETTEENNKIEKTEKIETITNTNSITNNIEEEEKIFPLEDSLEAEVMEIINNIGDNDKGTLNQFCDYLSQKGSSLTDEQKVLLAYLWITTNINYQRGTSVDPDILFLTKMTVCSGYARLFRRLLLAMNFPENNIENISGLAKGSDYSPLKSLNEMEGHEWNAVKLNNKWCLIDTTWGNPTSDSYYLCTPPQCLIKSHIPDERQKEFQLIENKITKEIFHNTIEGHEAMCTYDVKFIEDKSIQNVCGKGKITLTYNSDSILYLLVTTNMYVTSREVSSMEKRIEKGFEILFSVNEIGTYEISIFVSSDDFKLNFLASFYLKCDEAPKETLIYPIFAYDARYEDIEIITPLNRTVIKGQTYDFEIKIVGYDKLYIKQNGEVISMTKINDNTFREEGIYIHGNNGVYISYSNKTYGDTFISYDIIGDTSEYPTFYSTRDTFRVRLISPIKTNLIKGETYEFKIKCETIEKFRVDYGNNKIPLERNGNYYSKIITIDPSDTSSFLVMTVEETLTTGSLFYSYIFFYNLNDS